MGAKLALRKKKYQTNLLEKARNQLFNIEELIENVESAQMQQDIVAAMQTGTELLQQINSEMDLDEVEQLMDDTAEAIAYQQELNEILSQSLTDVDDEDVLNELAQIEQMEADQMELDMPDAPKREINKDLLRKLKKEQPKKQKKQVLVQ